MKALLLWLCMAAAVSAQTSVVVPYLCEIRSPDGKRAKFRVWMATAEGFFVNRTDEDARANMTLLRWNQIDLTQLRTKNPDLYDAYLERKNLSYVRGSLGAPPPAGSQLIPGTKPPEVKAPYVAPYNGAPAEIKNTETKDGRSHNWSLSFDRRRLNEFEMHADVLYFQSQKKDFKRAWQIKQTEIQSFTSLLKKFADWCVQARQDRAPEFQKALPPLDAGRFHKWVLEWNGSYGVLVSAQEKESMFDESDAHQLLRLLDMAPELMAEYDQKVAAAALYADKLK
jgi:hypothetical protein